MASSTSHPYYPPDISLPGFQPQLLSYPYILGVFFSTLGIITAGLLVWAAGKKYLSGTDKFLMCWFAMCGFIHFIVEGTVVVNNKFYQDTTGNILNEIWKEYAKADSRYATRDAFVIQMEAVTAFAWGPLSLLAAYGIATSKAWRFTLMTIVSMGQLYGDVLYYLTCLHVGVDKHSRPESLYFWFYFVIINAFWIVIPAWVIWRCCKTLNRAVAEQPESSKKSN